MKTTASVCVLTYGLQPGTGIRRTVGSYTHVLACLVPYNSRSDAGLAGPGIENGLKRAVVYEFSGSPTEFVTEHTVATAKATRFSDHPERHTMKFLFVQWCSFPRTREFRF